MKYLRNEDLEAAITAWREDPRPEVADRLGMMILLLAEKIIHPKTPDRDGMVGHCILRLWESILDRTWDAKRGDAFPHLTQLTLWAASEEQAKRASIRRFEVHYSDTTEDLPF